MKRNQITLMTVTFISGLILGISVIGLFAFTNISQVPAPLAGVNKISEQDAKVLFRNYFTTATPMNVPVKGFAISKEQLSALNMLANENPGLTAFRIYLGKDNSAGNVGILVGVNGSGMDVTNTIYRAVAGQSGPCPTICDAASTITSN